MANKVSEKVKHILAEKERARKKICITVNGYHADELDRLSKLHEIPVSRIIEACIEIGLADESINPKSGELEEDSFDDEKEEGLV